MVKRIIRDKYGNEMMVGDYFKVTSFSSKDAIPPYFEGMLGQIEEIRLDKKILYNFLSEPLQDRIISLHTFSKHCEKYKKT